MAYITYNTKVALNENQSVADENKCNASDLNEIKSVVNGNFDDIMQEINDLKPVILYTNDSGSTANITLSETSANFSALEIFYGADGFYYSTGKIYNPNSKKVGLFTPYISENVDRRVFVYTSDWQISGTSVNFMKAENKYMNENNAIASYGTNSYIRIYKVIGYK